MDSDRGRKPKHKKKYEKPKPWDDDPNIDRWKVEEFDPSWNEGGMLEVSTFSILFPRYREEYLQEVYSLIKQELEEYGVSCKFDMVQGSITVSTTTQTRDPYVIVKSRDLLRLLSRGVPAHQAIKILKDTMQYDIIPIRGLVRSKKRFAKRRQRLAGPQLQTLKAVSIVTDCYMLLHGNTVAAMGSFKGLKQVRKVVEDCLKNGVHPVHHLRILIIKSELAKKPALANENWERFFPKLKKKNKKQRSKYHVSTESEIAEDVTTGPEPAEDDGPSENPHGAYGKQKKKY